MSSRSVKKTNRTELRISTKCIISSSHLSLAIIRWPFVVESFELCGFLRNLGIFHFGIGYPSKVDSCKTLGNGKDGVGF
ncbi:hypothetical protein CEXT_763951 [Caerostris extrusa]|uniref:Uncharacterized protein n=1 Tax=Caerostris extrusa TaxID=172846 RepID=A0AAV4NP78_CAEEX|nr:hypothetical protein CEXT_763951 [Caerostris extrusa]